MLKKTVIEHYETQSGVADVLGISQAAVSRWPSVIPQKRALQLDRITCGKLLYEERYYCGDLGKNPA